MFKCCQLIDLNLGDETTLKRVFCYPIILDSMVRSTASHVLIGNFKCRVKKSSDLDTKDCVSPHLQSAAVYF